MPTNDSRADANGSERPIVLNGAQVRAVLATGSTQIRQPVAARNSTVVGHNVSNKSPLWTGLVWNGDVYADPGFPCDGGVYRSGYLHVPYVPPGEPDDGYAYRVRPRIEPWDRLWVRETWHTNHTKEIIHYRADYGGADPFNADTCGEDCSLVGEKWRPGIHMPRWASRIMLEATRVWPERQNPWAWVYELQQLRNEDDVH